MTWQDIETTLWEDRRDWRFLVHQSVWNRNAATRCLLIHLCSMFIFTTCFSRCMHQTQPWSIRYKKCITHKL